MNSFPFPPWLIFLNIVWVIPWKGVALWKAAKKSDKFWFIVLLVLNTFAILEILYIFWISRETEDEDKKQGRVA